MIGVDNKYKKPIEDILNHLKDKTIEIQAIYDTQENFMSSNNRLNDLSLIIADRNFIMKQKDQIHNFFDNFYILGNNLLSITTTDENGIIKVNVTDKRSQGLQELGMLKFERCEENSCCKSFIRILKSNDSKEIFKRYGL